MITLKGQLYFLFKLIGDLSMLFLVEMYSCIMVVMRCAHLKLQQIFHFFFKFSHIFQLSFNIQTKKKKSHKSFTTATTHNLGFILMELQF